MVSQHHQQNIGLNNVPDRGICFRLTFPHIPPHHMTEKYPAPRAGPVRWNEENSVYWETFWPSTHSSHPPQLCGAAVVCAVTGIYWMTFICWLAPGRQFHQEPSFCTPRTIILSNLTLWPPGQMVKHNWTKTWPGILLGIKGLGIHETDKEH